MCCHVTFELKMPERQPGVSQDSQFRQRNIFAIKHSLASCSFALHTCSEYCADAGRFLRTWTSTTPQGTKLGLARLHINITRNTGRLQLPIEAQSQQIILNVNFAHSHSLERKHTLSIWHGTFPLEPCLWNPCQWSQCRGEVPVGTTRGAILIASASCRSTQA